MNRQDPLYKTKQKRKFLSVVIIAKNEVDRIAKTLQSVQFADEIIVVDSGSTDGTQELCRKYNAKVIETDWPGFIKQKNRGFEFATYDWVLFLDADEVVSSQLGTDIQSALATDKPIVGYRIYRVNWWQNKPLYHGIWGRKKHNRLVRKGMGTWMGIDPHDHLVVKGKVSTLSGVLHHHPYRNMREHLLTIDKYAQIAAEHAIQNGRKCHCWDLVLRPPIHLFLAICFYMGWRDGYRGLCVAWLGAVYVMLKWWRIWVLQRLSK